MGKPAYVVRLEADANRVVLGERKDLLKSVATVKDFNWLVDVPVEAFRAFVKIRYNHTGQWARVSPDGDEAVVRFDEPASAVTAGQACAIYAQKDENLKLLGGGWL